MSVDKIFSQDIKKLPIKKFQKIGAVKLAGENLSGFKLRDYLEKEAAGGITITALEKKLKQEGLINEQWKKRGDIIKILSGEDGTSIIKKKPVPWYLRDSATDDPKIIKKTSVSIFDARRAASQVSVDTRSQGGKMNSSINPITGGISSVNNNKKPSPAKPSIPLAR
ncbi:hypothetical protein COU00_03110 [Candidatus Falkowbacteria bacterium CG10_big_fil_rev_8_21_14_0_10_43_11]|uniref:Uncharacterized protein n=1 Tax=Candidatus Falkowbacteria bacterium CG10_big_fil_rev_8_21_14_0_10_43_11 TaxID=1974568 RepID=A0A2M6WLP9_9BACT|nr:MAG: hypothetical protein COU00_03110 [Candidatus Falkowbacteria bacterium CG10_big_fil_rev_8_21_14_0_10_43_11]